MNDNYVVAFKSFRDEFRIYKQSPRIRSVLMDQNWLGSGLPDMRLRDSTGSSSGTASAPSSSLSQITTPPSPPSSDSSSAIAKTSSLAQEGRFTGNSPGEAQVAKNDGTPAAPVNLQPQTSRKGHKKSRQGCFTCKRRKIKCQETQPECENCTRKNVKCQYPAPKTLSELQISTSYAPNPIASVTLPSTPTNFTLTDMRLFHHFLMVAYPHLPLGYDSAWLCQVPLIAHHSEYLMHAILGLAASHLELNTGTDLRSVAIHHRILAIRGSNAAISQRHRTGSDADALLASCYALTFQSAYMRDGLPDFFQMARGCCLLTEQLKSENIPMAFFLVEKDHFRYMEDNLLDLPVINKELVDDAERSLAQLPPKFDQQCHPYFYQLLIGIIDELKVGSLGVYFKFIMVYQGLLKMENQMFQEFIDPSDSVARLLIAHFLAVQIIIAPIIDREYAGRTRNQLAHGYQDWLSMLYVNCPLNLRKYLEWPMAVKDCVRNEIHGKEKLISKISILRKNEGLSRANF